MLQKQTTMIELYPLQLERLARFRKLVRAIADESQRKMRLRGRLFKA